MIYIYIYIYIYLWFYWQAWALAHCPEVQNNKLCTAVKCILSKGRPSWFKVNPATALLFVSKPCQTKVKKKKMVYSELVNLVDHQKRLSRRVYVLVAPLARHQSIQERYLTLTDNWENPSLIFAAQWNTVDVKIFTEEPADTQLSAVQATAVYYSPIHCIISFLTMEYWNQTLQYFLGARGILHSTLPREYTDLLSMRIMR